MFLINSQALEPPENPHNVGGPGRYRADYLLLFRQALYYVSYKAMMPGREAPG